VSDINNTSNLRDDAHKDPATLEREIDQTRANMDRTLGALERKFSPGQLLDEAMSFAREHGGDFTTNLTQSIRDNPMPALLTTVGIVWMVASSNRPRSSMRYDFDDSYELEEDIERGSDSAKYEESGDEQGVLSKAGQQAKAAAEGVIAGAGQRARAVAEGARQKLAGSRQTLASSRGALETGMRRTTDTAQAQAQRVREGFNTLLTEQPLVLGALGIAVGALIGAALPSTEQEDRLLGPVRDRTLSEVKERGAESYNQVRESVSRVGEEAKQAISGSGGESSSRSSDAS
jgi:hypothetical protein